MKISIPACVFTSLMANAAMAYPELDKDGSGKPCSLLASAAQEAAFEKAGEGYKQVPTRAFNKVVSGGGGVPEGGFKAVEADLIKLMTDSQDEWPADEFADGTVSYAGLFIRLAWHCNGSYRQTDGRGGCDGGRIRFAPEADWDDNGNLDRARALLEPIKEKYGSDLSWGDLITLSGNAAIKSTGGENAILGFCGGRIDDADGSDSFILGPSAIQEQHSPCQSIGMQGRCLEVEGTALGPTTVEKIYVNPEGPITDPHNPKASAEDIRTAFSRMGFDDQMTTILIAGGHTIGKNHGPCPADEVVDGKCKGGEGTFTTGFHGAWTTTPSTWSNLYPNFLLNLNWTLSETPNGNKQWKPASGPDIVMLTADMALSHDESYKKYIKKYAEDRDLFDSDFAKAWYALTSGDMGPATRCIGDMVPEPQPFQNTLPDPPENFVLADFVQVAQAIKDTMQGQEDPGASRYLKETEKEEEEDEPTIDMDANTLIQLALNCASTFRATDYRGGCNGARIRFPPESEWESNADVVDHIGHLEQIKSEQGFDISMADMIVLAGNVALEHSNPNLDLDFCGGRVDAEDGSGSDALAPRFYSPPIITVTDDWAVKGLTPEEGVALFSATSLGSQYYIDLLAADYTSSYHEKDDVYTPEELALIEDQDLKSIVEKFADDETALLEAFTSAWTYMMTADRFTNNLDNACTDVSTVYKATSGANEGDIAVVIS